MAYMTDEEANALDEELTHTIPELGPNGEGFFSGKGQIIVVDEGTARILNAKALAARPPNWQRRWSANNRRRPRWSKRNAGRPKRCQPPLRLRFTLAKNVADAVAANRRFDATVPVSY